MEKALIVLGPSGVGKSTISQWFAADFYFLHYEADVWYKNRVEWKNVDGIDLHGIRAEWENFLNGVPDPLQELLYNRAKDYNRKGTILSLPSTIPYELLKWYANKVGIDFIILYGSYDNCLRVFCDREKETGRNLTEKHWIDNNNHWYSQPIPSEFSQFTVHTFNNGQRKSRNELVEEISRIISIA